MLRKTILGLAAGAALGAVALAPNAASAAWGGHGGWHNGWHGGWHAGWHPGWRPGFFRPGIRVFAGPVYGGCMVRRWVYTPYGPALRWVNRCY